MAQIPLQDYLEEIDTLIDESRLGEAVAHCRHVLERYPRYVGAYRLLGKALLEQNAYADAADVFRRILSANPEDFLAHVGLAIVHKQDEAFAEALWHMERAFEQEPYNAAIQEEMKELYGRRDGLAPEQVPLTRGALARLYVKGELYQQAVGELHDLLSGSPERLDLEVLLAEALWRDGRRVDAVERCQGILSRLPLCIKANAILAEVWLLTGREDGAQEYLQRLHELTQLTQGQLRGDSPPVRAFRADGAITLPEQVLIERMPEEMAFDAAGAAEGAGWVQEIDFEGGDALDEDFDWLEALQSDSEEAEPVDTTPDDEEEVMDWLRDVAAQGEGADDLASESEREAAPEETEWLEESESADDDEKAVTDDLPDWFEDVEDEEMDLGATADWFSEPAAEETGFDEEMEWEAWMASGQEGAPVSEDDEEWRAEVVSATGEGESDFEIESAPTLEDDSFPDWLQDEEEPARVADETGPSVETDTQAEDAADEQMHVEEVAMGTTDDHGNEWEDLPDGETQDDEQPEAAETTSDKDLDWLDELKDAGETEQVGSADESTAAAASDLPDWLRDEMESPPESSDTLDWLEEAAGEGSLRDDEAEELPAGHMPDWLRDEDEETADPGAKPEEDAFADEDLSWLDQIAAGAGEPIEEGPTLEWPETESGESEIPGDVPEEVGSSEEEVAADVSLEGSGESPEADEGVPEPTAGDAESAAPAETADVPEDLDDAMEWLEEMAAEGERAGQSDTAAEMEAETGLDWLEDLAIGDGDEEEAGLEDEDALSVEGPAEAEAEEPSEVAGDQAVLESEDEQIEEAAILEPEDAGELDLLDEMAAEDGGLEEDWLEDLPEDEDLVDAEEVDSLLGTVEAGEEQAGLGVEGSVVEEPDIPEGEVAPDEAAAPDKAGVEMPEVEAEGELDWLDEMEAPDARLEEDLPEDEDLAGEDEVESVLDEPEEALEAAEEPSEDQPEDLSDVPEDEEEAMAWLERLAAKQGASLDELPSVQEMAPSGDEALSETEEALDWLGELDAEEPDGEAEAPREMGVAEEEPAAEEDLEWLDDLVSGSEEEAAEEDVDWLAEEEVADAEVAAEMEAAVEEDLSWLDDLETEEEAAEGSAEEEAADVDEAMAWLEELASEEEVPAEEEAPQSASQAAPPDDAVAELSDEIPEDPDEALAWLEQLSGVEATEAPEAPVVEEQSTPVAPQDVVAAQAEAAALYEETPTAEEGDLDEVEPAVPVESAEEAEADVLASGYDEGEEEASDEPAAEERAEAALEVPAAEEVEAAEDLEIFAEEADFDIPEDPDEAMAWLERLAARQGASLDELPSVETAEEDVETPEWIAREMEETAAAEEVVSSDEAVAPDEADAPDEAETVEEEAVAEQMVLEEEAEGEGLAALEESAAVDEVASDEAIVSEEEAAAEEAATSEDVAVEDAILEEPPVEEITEEEEASGEMPAVEETWAEMETEEPELAEPAEVESERTFAEDLDDDFLGDLDEKDFDDSLPDWLKVDEGAGFGWGDTEPNVTGWLQAEEEATQYDMEIPEVPADWETAEDVERASEEAAPPAEEDVPAPQSLPPAATLDLDQERLESARSALTAGDYEAAVTDYRDLLDAGEGLNALIAEMESQVAAHSHLSTLRELLGDAYMRNGQLQKALDAYRQALDQL